MGIRIRYEKTEGEFLRSVRIFTGANGKQFRVLLDQSKLKFAIMNVTDNILAADGVGVSRAVIRLKAKRMLEQLGVSFEEETRERGDYTTAGAE